MHLVGSGAVEHVLTTYGYYAICVVVLVESAGIPFPGETILIAAAVFAGTRHQLDIRLVVLAAAVGAIIGDNIGFWVGRAWGERLLRRFGPKIGLDARKQMLGRYLFKRLGGPIVFAGRFMALLRAYAALLAGINRLDPLVFFIYNAAGGVTWACLFGFGGYLVGSGIDRIAGPFGYVILALGVIGAVVLWRFYKRHEETLLRRAEREMADSGGQAFGR